MHFANCGSMMNLTFTEEEPFGELLYILLRSKGVHMWDARPSFINLAHTPQELEFVINVFKESIAELQAADLLSSGTPVTAKKVDSTEDHERIPDAAQTSPQPPAPGARLGRDPQGDAAWFIADPKRPGKYLRVTGEDDS